MALQFSSNLEEYNFVSIGPPHYLSLAYVPSYIKSKLTHTIIKECFLSFFGTICFMIRFRDCQHTLITRAAWQCAYFVSNVIWASSGFSVVSSVVWISFIDT